MSYFVLPVVNVFGFLSQLENLPDGTRLNRVFPWPQRNQGHIAAVLAFHIVKADCTSIKLVSNLLYGRRIAALNTPSIRIGKNDHESLQLAKTFGTSFII